MNPKPTRIMGVVNTTPDSFYDGGCHASAEEAVAYGHRLLADGADILDIGGESSRPGAKPVALAEEIRRVLPVVSELAAHGATVSIDTYHAETAWQCLAAGATMVNDITALRGDAAMARMCADAGCDVVLMHMQGTPQTMQTAPTYDDVVNDIIAFFRERIAYATAAGIALDRIWIDPGFGFGKTVAHNLELLRRLNEFTVLGRPILVGTSNKSTIGAVLGGEPGERAEGTAATVAISILNGAGAVRVHDVKTMAKVARMTDAVRGVAPAR